VDAGIQYAATGDSRVRVSSRVGFCVRVVAAREGFHVLARGFYM